jgi:hypothetical protein
MSQAENANVSKIAKLEAASKARKLSEPGPTADPESDDIFNTASPTPTSEPAPEPKKKKAVKALAPLTVREEKLISAGVIIESDPPSGDEMNFMHSIMCQVGLPRSKVAGDRFERSCGNAALLVKAGELWDGKQFVQQEIPYGAMPRLILAYMNTYAITKRTPVIPIGNSAREFLKLLGKDSSGGPRGTLTTFRKQIQALAACHMVLGFNANGMAQTFNGRPIDRFEAWLSNGDSGQQTLWPGVITYSDTYYNTLIEHAVPIDVRAYYALKGSSLAMDIYIWLAERLYRLGAKPLRLNWKNLRDQFGQEYKGKEADKDFKKKFTKALNSVKVVYPTAKVQIVEFGLQLAASPPPIPPKLVG